MAQTKEELYILHRTRKAEQLNSRHIFRVELYKYIENEIESRKKYGYSFISGCFDFMSFSVLFGLCSSIDKDDRYSGGWVAFF